MTKAEIIKRFEEIKETQLYKNSKGYYTIDDEFYTTHRWHWSVIKSIVERETR